MLLSFWLLGFLALLTLSALAAAVMVEGRRRLRRRAGTIGWVRAWTGRGLSVALLFLLASATVADQQNRHFQYIPSFAALFGNISPNYRSGGLQAVSAQQSGQHGVGWTGSQPGTVVKIQVPGPASGVAARPAYVYLPAAYFDPAQANRRFPVLYLLHGSPGVAADWVRGGRLDQAMDRLISMGKVSPFVVVMPDTNGGYRRDLECQNVPNGVQDETYLTRDVVGYVDSHLRVRADRAARAIGGLSTGGYCAVNLALRNQGTFSVIMSSSGSGRPDHGIYTGDLFGHDRSRERANTPVEYLPTLPLRAPLHVYLDSGRTDRWATKETRHLHLALRQRGVPTTVRATAGGHSFETWRLSLYRSLPWISQRLEQGGDPPAPPPAGSTGETVRALDGPSVTAASIGVQPVPTLQLAAQFALSGQ